MGGFNLFGSNFDPIGAIGDALYLPGSKNNPQPQLHLPKMDSNSANQVAEQENNLQESPEQTTQKIMKDTGRASGVQNIGQGQSQENQSLGGGGMPGMSEAISNKAQKNFETQKARLQQNADLQGQEMSNKNHMSATTQAIALKDAETGVQSSINQLQLQANQATYQTVASIMTGAGSLGGMMYANSQRPTQNYPGLNSSLNSTESTFTNPSSGNQSYLNESPSMGGQGLLGDYSFE